MNRYHVSSNLIQLPQIAQWPHYDVNVFQGFQDSKSDPKVLELMNCQCGLDAANSNKKSSSPKKSMHLSLFAVSFFTIKASGHRFYLRKLTRPTCHLHLYSNFQIILVGCFMDTVPTSEVVPMEIELQRIFPRSVINQLYISIISMSL